MKQETRAKRGKWWCVGITTNGVYTPYLENTIDALARKFKLHSECQTACDKLNRKP